MGKKGDMARAMFYEGYNCSQCVAVAFCGETGIPRETMLRLSVGFGGGMGRLREVCGAVSGVVLVLGLLYGDDSPTCKAAIYPVVQQLAGQYRAENGSIVCKELLGLNKPEGSPVPEARTPEYYKKRPCPALIARAADMLAEYIAEHPPRPADGRKEV